jgi:hypothetical protein
MCSSQDTGLNLNRSSFVLVGFLTPGYLQVRMRRELQSAKDLFEELGRLAKNGQILTVSGWAHM